jgi:predicted RNase H-like HicB family nuclease
MRYPVVVTPDLEEGGFVVECPAIPGCVSEGETIEEAMANIRDAIGGCLAVLREQGDPSTNPLRSKP